MKTFKQFITESSNSFVSKFLDDIMIYYNLLSKKWKHKFPEEQIDAEYMEAEYDRNTWDGKIISFIVNCEKENTIATKFATFKNKPIETYRGRCYYNATSYVKRFAATTPGLELAFGILLEQKTLDDLETELKKDPTDTSLWGINFGFTLHAFCILNGKILDPTLKQSFKGDYYFYEIVPKEVWEKFKWVENDKTNADGRPLNDYATKRYESYMSNFNFISEYNKRFGK